jgi:hypothetical protein
VKIAVDELNIRPGFQPRSDSFWKKTAMAFSIIFTMCLLYAVFMGLPLEWPKMDRIKVDKNEVKMIAEPILTFPPVESVKEVTPPLAKTEPPQPPEPVLTKTISIEKVEALQILPFIKETATREMTLLHIASLWNSELMVHLNPLTQQIESNIQFFKILGIEAITPEDECVIFPVGEKKYKIGLKELLPYLVGDMYIAWKDNFGYDRVISNVSSKDSIMSLKLLLSEIGFPLVDKTSVYDGPVEHAIKQIQQKYGLKVDGLVGPLTKMVLFNEKKQNAVPYLNSTRALGQ